MWKYNGNGFIVGIPARDLSDEEAKKIGIDRVKKCGLYTHKKDKRPVTAGLTKETQWQEPEHSEKYS